MKTVIVTIEQLHTQSLAVSIPDWWDEKTARERLSSPINLADLEDIADPDEWESAGGDATISSIEETKYDADPVASFGSDEPMPPHPNQIEISL